MKNLLLLFSGCVLFFLSSKVTAQTFTVTADTVNYTVTGTATVNDNITNNTNTSGMTIRWTVIASDFPADWRSSGAFGICDNNNCYPNTGDTALWNGTTGRSHASNPYVYNVTGLFDLSLNFATVSLGTHYVTVALTDVAGTYTKNVTFVITKIMPSSVAGLGGNEDKVVLYPNPTTDEVNVVFDANADVKNIAVYNIIGKVMSVYKVSGSSANLTLENMPSGIYFVRLLNAHGAVVATRKFTKQ